MGDLAFKAEVVAKILQGRPEEALRMLAAYHRVDVPDLRVGAVRRHGRNALAVYVAKERAIYASRREVFFDPQVILHEFYHHLRTRPDTHRGTERYADRFANDYLQAYLRLSRLAGEADQSQ